MCNCNKEEKVSFLINIEYKGKTKDDLNPSQLPSSFHFPIPLIEERDQRLLGQKYLSSKPDF